MKSVELEETCVDVLQGHILRQLLQISRWVEFDRLVLALLSDQLIIVFGY